MKITNFKCKGCYHFGDKEKSFIADTDFNFIEGTPMQGKTSYLLALKGICEVLANDEVFFDHTQEHFLKHEREFSISFSLGENKDFNYSVKIDVEGRISYESLSKMITPKMRGIVFERKDSEFAFLENKVVESIVKNFKKESNHALKPLIGEILSKTKYREIAEAFKNKVRFIKADNLSKSLLCDRNFYLHKELFSNTEYTSIIASDFRDILHIFGRKIENLKTKPNFLNTISPFDFDYFTPSMINFIVLCAATLDSSKNGKVYIIDDLHLMLPFEYRAFLLMFCRGMHPKVIASLPYKYLEGIGIDNKRKSSL